MGCGRRWLPAIDSRQVRPVDTGDESGPQPAGRPHGDRWKSFVGKLIDDYPQQAQITTGTANAPTSTRFLTTISRGGADDRDPRRTLKAAGTEQVAPGETGFLNTSARSSRPDRRAGRAKIAVYQTIPSNSQAGGVSRG